MGLADLLDDPVSTDAVESYEEYIAKMASMPEWQELWDTADEVKKIRLVNSWLVVQDFRAKSTHLTAMWGALRQGLESSASRGEDFEIELPSHRSLIYKHCRFRKSTKKGGGHDIVADITRNGQPQTTRLTPPLVYENMVQGTSRCVHRDGLLRLHEAGYKVVLHVHDEAVVHVPKKDAEFHRAELERIMGIPPTWAPNLPVAAEATIAESYDRAK